uniref:Uncharacterized protein n=1 Tax=Seriola lalandi dorsalis TaxID=1841481 RepID=A0A3B4Y6X1_SERLL
FVCQHQEEIRIALEKGDGQRGGRRKERVVTAADTEHWHGHLICISQWFVPLPVQAGQSLEVGVSPGPRGQSRLGQRATVPEQIFGQRSGFADEPGFCSPDSQSCPTSCSGPAQSQTQQEK